MKRTWAVMLMLLVASASMAQFTSSVWKRHSANSVQVGRTSYQYAVLPTCPDDRSVLEFGAICKDPATGKIFYRGTLEAVP